VKIGKWTQNVGALSTWLLGALLLTIAGVLYGQRGPATPLHFLPTWNWDTVGVWATIAFAMSGLEMVALMGGEIRDPERTLPRAGWIASGFSMLFYGGGTIALLVILRPEKISELNGLAETGAYAAGALHMPWLSPVIAVLVMASAVGQFGGLGTSVSRLPFAVGVDHLLPEAFGRVHPRWGTPHVSIFVLGVIASVLLIAIQLGDTMRAAYQALLSLTVITGFLPYLYIFGSSWKAGKRLSAISGWAIVLVAILCSVVPTDEVKNVWVFEGKLAAGTFGVIATAWVLYRRVEAKAGQGPRP
jgi:APA family basic amino acid/polyamine antiporter